jgi:hypothetical protein
MWNNAGASLRHGDTRSYGDPLYRCCTSQRGEPAQLLSGVIQCMNRGTLNHKRKEIESWSASSS